MNTTNPRCNIYLACLSEADLPSGFVSYPCIQCDSHGGNTRRAEVNAAKQHRRSQRGRLGKSEKTKTDAGRVEIALGNQRVADDAGHHALVLTGKNIYDALESDLARPLSFQHYDRKLQNKIQRHPLSIQSSPCPSPPAIWRASAC
jgi:hypothetical protein